MNNQDEHLVSTPGMLAYSGLAIAFLITFFPVMKNLFQTWLTSDDNSHGLLILPLSLYIVWNHRHAIQKAKIIPGRGGMFWVTTATLLYLFGHLASILTVGYLSFVLTIWAVVWSLYGKEIFRVLCFPMVFLLLMIPVPSQFYSMATIPLQLIVTKYSALIISLCDISVLREGNVLHLPHQSLQVVQACSGLRSLMALVTLCAIFAYLTLTSNLLRSILVVSSIPAAIIVNIVRVVSMVLAFQLWNLDLSKGLAHTIFGVGIFFLALMIIILFRGILAKWDVPSTAA